MGRYYYGNIVGKFCFENQSRHPENISCICYEMDETITKWIVYSCDLQKIYNIVNDIDKKIHVSKYILHIDYDENNGFAMNIQFSKKETNAYVEILLARWVLGKQILHYFKKTNNETCVFYGEN